jgi:hypothetical protein
MSSIRLLQPSRERGLGLFGLRKMLDDGSKPKRPSRTLEVTELIRCIWRV